VSDPRGGLVGECVCGGGGGGGGGVWEGRGHRLAEAAQDKTGLLWGECIT
jgi:hypothetical protein